MARGDQPLPEDDINKMFKPPPQPSRLDSLLLAGQINCYAGNSPILISWSFVVNGERFIDWIFAAKELFDSIGVIRLESEKDCGVFYTKGNPQIHVSIAAAWLTAVFSPFRHQPLRTPIFLYGLSPNVLNYFSFLTDQITEFATQSFGKLFMADSLQSEGKNKPT